MRKVSLLLVLFMLILTGCFDKKTHVVDESSSEFLEISNFTSGNTSIGDGSTTSSSTINVSSTIIPIDRFVTISFTESINAQTVDALSVYINDANQQPIAAELTVVDNQVNIIPNEFFLPDERYTIVITTAVKDIQGRSLEGAFIYTFSTEPLADTTPPTLTSLTPPDGAINVDKTTDVVMTFDENIANNGVTLEVRDSLNVLLTGTNTVSANTLNFSPASDLTYGESYTVTLQGSVEDLSGNVYNGISTWSFTVAPLPDTTPPTLTSVTPTDGAINVDMDTDINVTFDENVTTGSNPLLLTDNTLGMSVSGISGVTVNTLWFIPDSPLIENHNYTIDIHGPVRDLAGNSYTGETSWSFTVAPLVDMASPTLTSLTPADNATNVDKTTDVVMTFDENIANNGVTLEVRDSLNVLLTGTNTVSTNTLNFNPASDLTYGESYTVILIGNIEDLSGNIYTGISTWNFTVAPLVDSTPPNLTSLTPTDNATNVDKSINMTMVFDENIADNGVTLEVRDSLNILVTGTNTVRANTLNFNPVSDLTEGETYIVVLQGNVADLAGNIYTGISTWSFSVISLPQSMLTVIRIKNNNDKINLEFYEKLDRSSVNASDFLINNGAISFSEFKFIGGDHQVEFKADSPLHGDEVITVSGTVKDIDGNIHNSGVAADYSLAGILSVRDVQKGGSNKITVKFWEISSILDTSTVNASDFLINAGAITFSGFRMKNDFDVEFIADSNLNGDELITISSDIQDMDGNFHNNGVSVLHTFR